MNLQQIGERVHGLGFKCTCGTRITYNDIKHEDHSAGIQVDGFGQPQWIWFHCSNRKCGYDWALWKILKRCGVEEA